MARLPEHDMRRRQRRRRKVRALRQRLAQTTDPQQRQRIIAKIKKIAPTAPVPDK
ncbi:MAG: DUF6800 family protein [Anaerolineae bacterium]